MLACKLALAQGKGLFELLTTTSALEWSVWREYDRLDPFGRERFDELAGCVAAAVVNVWKGGKDSPADPLDMVPDYGGLRAAARLREAEGARRTATAEGWAEHRDQVARLERARRGG